MEEKGYIIAYCKSPPQMTEEELAQGCGRRYHGAEGRGQLVHTAGGGEDEHFVAQRLGQLGEHQLQHLPVSLLEEGLDNGGRAL